MEKIVDPSLEKNMEYLNQVLHVDQNFDIVYRIFHFAKHNACIYFVDGFLKDDIMQKLMQFFYSMKEEDFPKDAHEMSKLSMPYVEVDLVEDWDTGIKNLLSGVVLLLIEGYDRVITIDCRTYPMRSVEEPEKDKVLRGSKDGFVETLVYNTALIRRRIRNPELCMEITSAGKSSKTDIVICYMNSRVDQEFLEEIRRRIQSIQVDALTMNQQSLAECIYRHRWYNPFPKFKFSERPDTAAAHILEGNIVILVDNSPSSMILPTSVFDIIEEADDYYFPPITGTYLRLSRFVITLMTLFLTPLFLLLTQNPQWVPEAFSFILIQDEVNVPIIWQLLILEFAVDGLKLAALNTPSMLSTPLSVITALVIGEFSVNSGWFNAETMLYMAFVALANYTQASYELGYALKFMRIITLILTGIFGLYGFIIGNIITVLSIACNKMISGKSYIYPLIPFNGRELFKRLFRVRLSYWDEKGVH